MKNNLPVLLIICVVILAALVYVFYSLSAPAPEVKLAALPAQKIALPKVVTLYQKGESESDLAVFVSNELSRELSGKASFRLVNIADEPQMAEFYGVDETPAVIILTPAGAVQAKHEGYWEKASIVAVLKTLGTN
jgi:hypothetical protein